MTEEETNFRQVIIRHKKELKRRRKHRGKVQQYQKRSQAFFFAYMEAKQEYGDIASPECFSILRNRSNTITYLKKIERALKNQVHTRMNLSAVKDTDLATICLLSAYMLDARTPSRYLKVTIPPKGSEERRIWDEVEFDRMIIKAKRPNFSHGRFLSRSANKVNDDAISDILKETMEFFGKENLAKLQDLSAVIVEIVENTGFHAYPRKERFLPWIINTRQVKAQGYSEMEFCIVDMGVGIYDSIRKNVDKWNTFLRKAEHKLTVALHSTSAQSRFLSENIPKGVGSSTNDDRRGRGIRYIQKMAQAEIYEVFDIITNKAEVKLKSITSISTDSSESLAGTIYYWKVRIYDN